MYTMDLEEIKRHVVTINAITEINNTLEGNNSRITETEKELSPRSSGCIGPGGSTTGSISGGGGCEEILLVQGKEQWLHFSGAALK